MDKVMCGGCLCGSVRYEYDGQPGDSSYCHCDDCKRATGGPYTVGVHSQADRLRIVRGEVKGYTTRGDSGSEITREFCPECGSPLFTRGEHCAGFVYIKAGSLDEPELVKPSCEIWTERAVKWAYVDASLPTYPKGGTTRSNDSEE